ncbi:MAG: isoprenyl transferase [Firmicutes bacterium]|nr:isoprenyl transferase [Bacillota bacterium]
MPQHVAIIMDGNGRWAQSKGLPRTAGHQAGLKRVSQITEECAHLGIKYLTLYAFSTENWQRPAEEVNFLMDLFYQTLKNETDLLCTKGVKIKFIGLPNRLDPKLLALMEECAAKTKDNDRITLNLAINYGGRLEIIKAVRELLQEAAERTLRPEEVTPELFAGYLFTAGQPDPDLIIRTSGEQRISNFLLWQSAYAELFFTKTLWPDFDRLEFHQVLLEYKRRSRRFGGLEEGGGT